MEKIPLIRPQFPKRDVWYSIFEASLREGRLANHGPSYRLLRNALDDRFGFGYPVSNATVGLELALRARFRQGARIMIPSFTFRATYLAVVNAGMTPVISSVDPETWAIDPEMLSVNTIDGAIVVAPFGHTIDFGSYEAMGIPIVYDLAGAWGLDYRGPNIAVYSWHATKNFCVGEGGCVVSQNVEFINEVQRLANFGHTNAKLSEIQCAIALGNIIEGVKSYFQPHFAYWEGGFNRVFKKSTLKWDHISLSAFSVPAHLVYELTNQSAFETRRYYFPLIEDLYPSADVLYSTPRDHPARSIIAFPRDVFEAEHRLIQDAVKRICRGL